MYWEPSYCIRLDITGLTSAKGITALAAKKTGTALAGRGGKTLIEKGFKSGFHHIGRAIVSPGKKVIESCAHKCFQHVAVGCAIAIGTPMVGFGIGAAIMT